MKIDDFYYHLCLNDLGYYAMIQLGYETGETATSMPEEVEIDGVSYKIEGVEGIPHSCEYFECPPYIKYFILPAYIDMFDVKEISIGDNILDALVLIDGAWKLEKLNISEKASNVKLGIKDATVLEELYIPASVNDIITIDDCPSLKKIEFADDYYKVLNIYLENLESLEYIKLPILSNTVSLINCNRIKEINFQYFTNNSRGYDTVTIKDCDSIEELVFPNDFIGTICIENCENLKTIKYPSQFNFKYSEYTLILTPSTELIILPENIAEAEESFLEDLFDENKGNISSNMTIQVPSDLVDSLQSRFPSFKVTAYTEEY